MSKKPRADAKLITLPKDVQRAVAERLDRESQAKVRAWLLEAHQVDVSPATLTAFYQWWHSRRILESVASDSNQFKQTLLELKAAGELNFSDETAGAIAQAYFEHQSVRREDPKLYAMMKVRRQTDRSLDLREREVKVKERAIAVLEQKAAQADKAKAIAEDKTLTEEQRTQRMREVFLL